MRNLVSRWCFLALLFVPLATSSAWAQTFTGGVRGVVSDSGGVVPGVTVTLINEATGATRDAVSNERGQYDFSAVPPAVYTIKAELTGFKTYENKGHSRRHPAVRDHGHPARRRPAAGNDHGHRRRAAHRHVECVDGRGDRFEAARDAAERRPIGVPVCGDRAHRGGHGRPAVQPPAGSNQRVIALARRRHAARQQLPGGRRADHRHAQSSDGESHDRSD